MATNRGVIRTRFRYAIRDAEAPYTVDPGDAAGVVNAWYDAARAHINRRVRHIQTTGSVVPDGAKYTFDLATDLMPEDGIGAALTNFLIMRYATIISASGQRIVRHPRGFNYLRDLGSMNGILAGTPTSYAIRGTDIIFNAILAAPAIPAAPTVAELITLDYWATPAASANDAHVPEYPLNSGWDNLIIDAMKIEAGDEITGGDELKAKSELGFEKRIQEFDDFVFTLGQLDESDGIVYSDMGDPRSSEGAGDYKATNPFAY